MVLSFHEQQLIHVWNITMVLVLNQKQNHGFIVQ